MQCVTCTVHSRPRQIEQSTPDNDALAPRIALVAPYNWSNLGDASIQDAVVANIGGRRSAAQCALQRDLPELR